MKIGLGWLTGFILAIFFASGCASGSGGAPKPALSAEAEMGKNLFETKGECNKCHEINHDKIFGLGLAGIKSRHSDEWLKKWISNPEAVWSDNDPETQALKKRFRKTEKPKLEMEPGKLSDAEADRIIEYLKTL